MTDVEHIVTADEDEAMAYQALNDKAHGHPTLPTGFHGCTRESVPMDVGVTLHQNDVTKHPTKKLWSHPKMHSESAKLTGQERAWVVSHNAKAAELTDDWNPEVVEDA